MKYPIENEYDYLVAEVQKLSDGARQTLAEARASGDYYREKLAAKLVEFCEAEEKYFSRYVELKLDYSELAKTLEERRTYLVEIMNQAKAKYDQLKSGL